MSQFVSLRLVRGVRATPGISHLGVGALGACVWAWPVTAHANPIAPMLVVLWPGSWLVLLPVIVVEALVARRLLHLEFRESLKLSAVANLWSTLVGIPMTWCVLLLLGLIAKPLEIFAEGLGADQLGWVLAAPPLARRRCKLAVSNSTSDH